MGLFTKDIKSMEDLFLHTLQDIYYAENQIVRSLPKMIDKATNRQLAKGLRDHLRETKRQVERLHEVFDRLDREPKGTTCPAMDGLISEADEIAGEVDDKKVLDAAIIGAAQAVEHYEIARYGTLIAWARELGYTNVVGLLNASLKEEKATDKKLTSMAEGKVNRRATGKKTSARKTSARKTSARKSTARRKTASSRTAARAGDRSRAKTKTAAMRKRAGARKGGRKSARR